eukprot:scaffold154087_cov22-Cyclotella_meneghiniana.AAC.1
MVRLILLTAPIACVLGGIVVGRVAGWCVEGVLGLRLDVEDVISLISGEEDAVAIGDDSNGAKGEKKKQNGKKDVSNDNGQKNKQNGKNDGKDKGSGKAETKKTSIRNNLLYQLVVK